VYQEKCCEQIVIWFFFFGVFWTADLHIMCWLNISDR
jgi:hypothetical protein